MFEVVIVHTLLPQNDCECCFCAFVTLIPTLASASNSDPESAVPNPAHSRNSSSKCVCKISPKLFVKFSRHGYVMLSVPATYEIAVIYILRQSRRSTTQAGRMSRGASAVSHAMNDPGCPPGCISRRQANHAAQKRVCARVHKQFVSGASNDSPAARAP
jgi:hypothetical protein